MAGAQTLSIHERSGGSRLVEGLAAAGVPIAELAEAYTLARVSPDPWLIEVATDPDARPPLVKFDPVA